jgi:hypothetical protein
MSMIHLLILAVHLLATIANLQKWRRGPYAGLLRPLAWPRNDERRCGYRPSRPAIGMELA